MITRRMLFSSYTTAMQALQEAVLHGWRLDANDPPVTLGWTFELPLIRDDEPPAKLERSEILAKARAAKAQRKTEGQ